MFGIHSTYFQAHRCCSDAVFAHFPQPQLDARLMQRLWVTEDCIKHPWIRDPNHHKRNQHQLRHLPSLPLVAERRVTADQGTQKKKKKKRGLCLTSERKELLMCQTAAASTHYTCQEVCRSTLIVTLQMEWVQVFLFLVSYLCLHWAPQRRRWRR